MQVIIIGLGQFGMALARSMAHYGAEVIAVDASEDKVNQAAEFVSEAVRLDAMDETALASLAPEKRDLCVCGIGEASREGSIIATALLRQLGAQRVVARAIDDLHARILRLVGAHEVVSPEKAFGERLAMRLVHRRIRDVLPLGSDVVITEMDLPATFVGHSISDLSLRRRYGVTVMAVRRIEEGEVRVTLPDPDKPLSEGDVLLVVSTPEAARRLDERV